MCPERIQFAHRGANQRSQRNDDVAFWNFLAEQIFITAVGANHLQFVVMAAIEKAGLLEKEIVQNRNLVPSRQESRD